MNRDPAIHIMLGTAGHIDHGKTALVKLLTGCDTDRLPEEKARGMTIDLGFATCRLPDGRQVGLVDVPGHERFIHNMVAGVTGIDVVLLVVAADDGVMPQTTEHFHIVRLLGVRRGLVAITKSDLADAARLVEVAGQIRALTAGSFLEQAPLLPVSSKTGAGFDAFYDALVHVVAETVERKADGPFRLHVERSFVVKGVGVILSGIPRSGRVRVGDTLEWWPGGDRKKVRALQVYGAEADEARAGECVALRLTDLDREQARRGCVLATPGYYKPARFFNVHFQSLPGALEPIRPRTAIRFHVGTTEVGGHLVLPTLEPLPPGAACYAQIQLEEPVIAAPGDPYVVRRPSPARTLGGGHIVTPDEQRLRRSRPDWSAARQDEDQSFRDPAAALLHALRAAGLVPLKLSEAAHRALLTEDAAKQEMETLITRGESVCLGDRYASTEALERLQADIGTMLGALRGTGLTRLELQRKTGADPVLLEAAVQRLAAAGRLARRGDWIGPPGRETTDDPVSRALLKLYRTTGFASPRPEEVAERLGQPPRIVEPAIRLLLQRAELVQLSDKVILHADVLEKSRQALIAHLKTQPRTDAVRFKQVLGTSKKYAIAILEYWDRKGLTRRIGDERMLASKPPGSAGSGPIRD